MGIMSGNLVASTTQASPSSQTALKKLRAGLSRIVRRKATPQRYILDNTTGEVHASVVLIITNSILSVQKISSLLIGDPRNCRKSHQSRNSVSAVERNRSVLYVILRNLEKKSGFPKNGGKLNFVIFSFSNTEIVQLGSTL